MTRLKHGLRRCAVGLLVALLPALAFASNCSPQAPEPFDQFFARFLNDHAFAVSRTVFPLRMLRQQVEVDAKGNERVSNRLSLLQEAQAREESSLAKRMSASGLVSELKSLTPTHAEVAIFKPNTDWLLRYRFERSRGCWMHREIHDYSL